MVALRKRQMREETAAANKSHLYQEVAAALRKRILAARGGPTTKLPSFNDLISEFKVSSITIRRALRELAYEGLIWGEQGRGIFIKPKNVIHRVFAWKTESSMVTRSAVRASHRTSRNSATVGSKRTKRLHPASAWKPAAKFGGTHKLVFADKEPVGLHVLHFTGDVARELSALSRPGFRVSSAAARTLRLQPC